MMSALEPFAVFFGIACLLLYALVQLRSLHKLPCAHCRELTRRPSGYCAACTFAFKAQYSNGGSWLRELEPEIAAARAEIGKHKC